MANSDVYFTSPHKRRMYIARKVGSTTLTYAFLGLLGLFMIVPFVFMIITSFRNADAYDLDVAHRVFNLIPSWWNSEVNASNYTLDNYATVFNYRNPVTGEAINFAFFYINTVYVSVVSTIFTLITSVLAAFAFARCNFKGKNLLFTILLATMMIPGEMMVITNYQTVKLLGWDNTFAALIFVHGVSVFYIFYLRQTFQQIPNELFLAAKVDGYGHFRYLLRVMIPIAMPTIVTITILSLMGSWNAYIWPNLVASGKWRLNDQWSMKLVSNGLMSLFTNSDTGLSRDTVRIAGSMVCTLPLFVFFLIFRKYIMRGVSRSGIKG
ncbi:MAG: carbohydrate ABC transporter permease [Bacilli bacterium]|nr:carbohydrate ABC transporter permease [Bacilli bacterium]